MTQRDVNASNATHGPDPSPDLSVVRSPCLNINSTNPHLSPCWSLGPDRGQGQSQGQLTRLKLVLDRGRDLPHEKRRVEQFLGDSLASCSDSVLSCD